MTMNPPSVNFAHICDMAFLSKEGKLNIIGIFRNIHVQKLPINYPRISCAINLNIKKESRLKLQILCKESRELIAKMQGTMTPQKGNEKDIEVGFIGDFQNIRLEKFGQYDFEIWINDDLIHTIPFFVHETKPK